MSTRCHTIVTKKGKEAFIYRHFDGYPSGAGEDLKTFIKENKENLDEWSVNDFGVELHNYDIEFEFENSGIHGDEDYIYFIDLDDNVFECYAAKDGDVSYNKSEMNLKFKENF